MKTRNGFVSNSSSASFVVTWKSKDGGLRDVYDTLYDLFECDTNDRIKFLPLVDNLCDFTTINDDGNFVSMFATGCLNTFDDFGEEAKIFIFYLACNKLYDMVSSKVIEDELWDDSDEPEIVDIRE